MGLPDSRKLSYSVRRRMEFIEFQVFWSRSINRSDIMQRFGISEPAAAKDFRLYQDHAPGNIEYSHSEKAYLETESFKPVFLRPDAQRFLQALEPTSGRYSIYRGWLKQRPDAQSVPTFQRQIDPLILRSVVQAIDEKTILRIKYQSMNPNRPDPVWRKISPHAFGFDGQRWHVRGWCHIDGIFKDFILSRCANAKPTDAPGEDPILDRNWHEDFEIVLVANPRLSEAQRASVEMDYGMKRGEIRIMLRKAMLYYFQKRFRFDIDPLSAPPHETPLVIQNAEEFATELAHANT